MKQKYIEASILIPSNWDVEFHVHTYVFLFIVEALLPHNIAGKSEQPIVYASRLLNNVDHTITPHKWKL
jgi:hypothetical protein